VDTQAATHMAAPSTKATVANTKYMHPPASMALLSAQTNCVADTRHAQRARVERERQVTRGQAGTGRRACGNTARVCGAAWGVACKRTTGRPQHTHRADDCERGILLCMQGAPAPRRGVAVEGAVGDVGGAAAGHV
jgi:hypothetical protein